VKVCSEEGGGEANCAFTKGRAAAGAVKAFSAVNGAP